MNFLLFLAPFSWGTQKREAAAPKASGCFMGGTCDVREGAVKAEPAKLPGAGIWPEAVPRKMRGRKRVVTEISEYRRQKQT